MIVLPIAVASLAYLLSISSSCKSDRVISNDTLENFASKPRVFVLTDIANEPDDLMSLTRFLLYANQFQIEGLTAVTSTWLRNETFAWQVQDKVRQWAAVRDNLTVHAEGWPEAGDLLSRVYSGPPKYGLQGVGKGLDSNGSNALIQAVDHSSASTPLWVLAWGGTNVLAQALWKVRQSRDSSAVTQFVSQLRVYAISDQDDTGPWIRRNFPEAFYIASHHAFNIYNTAAWTGISGEVLYAFDGNGPDTSLVTNEWLQDNIRSSSNEFSATYPDFAFIMEGDTPSFLHVIQNGLSVPGEPYWGSWGGRYGRMTHDDNIWVDTSDTNVTGIDEVNYTSNHATIWRWRKAYQLDFASRMNWTAASDFSQANHNPIVVLNDTRGPQPLYLDVKPGDRVTLSAKGSHDPDGDHITYKWWQHLDASTPQAATLSATPQLSIEVDPAGLVAKATIPNTETLLSTYEEWSSGEGTPVKPLLHIILEVWDDGIPPLVSYRRAVLNVTGLE